MSTQLFQVHHSRKYLPHRARFQTVFLKYPKLSHRPASYYKRISRRPDTLHNGHILRITYSKVSQTVWRHTVLLRGALDKISKCWNFELGIILTQNPEGLQHWPLLQLLFPFSGPQSPVPPVPPPVFPGSVVAVLQLCITYPVSAGCLIHWHVFWYASPYPICRLASCPTIVCI